ncbi:hypothetical protein FBBAL38_07545 [Flavobacteria bacterium BAL38]|nr:hypothetical protein FBBAL38_07545 [Flavobacteria bacterium BAL38]
MLPGLAITTKFNVVNDSHELLVASTTLQIMVVVPLV